MPTYKEHKELFFDQLSETIGTDRHFGQNLLSGDEIRGAFDNLKDNEVFVLFDFHLKQIIKDYEDVGEMSDIVIWGKNVFISIEAKYLSYWSFSKDISEVQERLIEAQGLLNKKSIQVLLLLRNKWNNVVRYYNNPGSEYKKLLDNSEKLTQTFFLRGLRINYGRTYILIIYFHEFSNVIIQLFAVSPQIST